MSVSSIVLAVLTAAAVGWAGYRFYRLARPLWRALGPSRLDHPLTRLWGVVEDVGGHSRLLRIPYSGVLHLMIFWGFLVLITGIVEAFGDLLHPGFSLSGIGGNSWIAMLQDVFDVLVIVGIAMAVWNRWVRRPIRLEGSNQRDAAIILGLILAIVSLMLMQNSFEVAAGGDPSAPWRPVSSALATIWGGLGIHGLAAADVAQAFLWGHVLAVLTFLSYIPSSKHLHILAGIPNIFFRNLQPPGRLPTPDLESSSLGISEVHQLGWKQLLDLHACTECGRCQDACPAFATGQPLSPKTLIMNLRDNLLLSEGLQAHGGSGGGAGKLVGDAISRETLWACTTCGACMQACPLRIEHVPKIVGMRQYLAMEEGELPTGLDTAMASLDERGHPWRGTTFSRTQWADGLGVRVLAPGEETDVLLWVGCTAALNARPQEALRAFVGLLQRAGVDFAILGDDEQCTGDAARRAGNEYLFQRQAAANIATLGQRRFRVIVSTCPHCLNSLGNEYQDFGGRYQVLHHSQMLSQLIRENRLPSSRGSVAATFHDPCYLGRYGGEFAAPRGVVSASGFELKEMVRSKTTSFCCGAGGGRVFMPPGQTAINVERAREAKLTGSKVLATACPFCMIMMEDGSTRVAAESGQAESRQQVLDVAELLAGSMLQPEDA